MENNEQKEAPKKDNQKQIAGAIVLAGLLIAGAVLLKDTRGARAPLPITDGKNDIALSPVNKEDRVLGSTWAKVTVVEYADFQCPFCGKFHKEVGTAINENYVKTGKVKFVYRDYAFLGEESIKSAEAARCAGDQDKFWEYHDYLFTHQNGENKGSFSNPNLKSFAKILGLNETNFNQCLDSEKYKQAILDSSTIGNKAGVRGTPKGFILKDGVIVDTIDGAEPAAIVTAKIEKALK